MGSIRASKSGNTVGVFLMTWTLATIGLLCFLLGYVVGRRDSAYIIKAAVVGVYMEGRNDGIRLAAEELERRISEQKGEAE